MFWPQPIDVVVPEGRCINGVIGDGEKTIAVSGLDPFKAVLLGAVETDHLCITAPVTVEEEKLCELAEGQTNIEACLEIIKGFLETIATNPIASIDGDAVNINKCTPDGLPLIFCKKTDAVTGEVSFETFALQDGQFFLYEGTECIDCGPKKYNTTGLWIAEGDLCGYQVFDCEGTKQFYNPETCKFEDLPLGTITTPYNPGNAEDICDDAQTGPINLPAGATTVADIIAANIAGLTFDLEGTVVPVTADDVESIKITPKPCKALDADGVPVTADWIVVNEVNAGNYVDVPEGGVDGDVKIEVPTGGCAIVEICFKRCVTKQELAGLGKEG